jgi:hypothetical protein
MRKYQISEEDLKAVQAAHDAGKDVNPIWREIAKRMGFEHDSMLPTGEPGCFSALPLADAPAPDHAPPEPAPPEHQPV